MTIDELKAKHASPCWCVAMHNHFPALLERYEEMRLALQESHALNVNIVEECSDETRAYYSEYKSVYAQCAAALTNAAKPLEGMS